MEGLKKQKRKYSLEKIKYKEGSDIVSCYVVVNERGDHRSGGESRAIRVDNHYVITGTFSLEKLHNIKEVCDGDTDIESIDEKVRNLAQRELEDLVKREEELPKLWELFC